LNSSQLNSRLKYRSGELRSVLAIRFIPCFGRSENQALRRSHADFRGPGRQPAFGGPLSASRRRQSGFFETDSHSVDIFEHVALAGNRLTFEHQVVDAGDDDDQFVVLAIETKRLGVANLAARDGVTGTEDRRELADSMTRCSRGRLM
jgi:hypothetical protein